MKYLRSIVAGLLLLACTDAEAAQTNVAVAANFADAAKEIAALFKQRTGHEAVLSFGASGQFYTQIPQGAPFQVFLSADDSRPRKLIEDGLAVAESRFTYAIGKLVLWSKTPGVVKGEERCRQPPSQSSRSAILPRRPMASPPWKR